MSESTSGKVAIVGGGVAGQRFIAALQNHPWFRITTLAASERSANKSYGDAARTEWRRPLVLRREPVQGPRCR